MKTRIACFAMLAVLGAGAQTTTTLRQNTSTATATTSQATLPVGTAVRMKLETTLSTSINKPGDRFAGRVIEAVRLNGRDVIPVGASVEGHVLRASEPRRIAGLPTLDLRPETVILPNGQRMSMSASLVDSSNHPDVEINEEGEVKGRGHDGRDWKEMGIGAGAGTGIGLLAAGGKGALIGAGVGATASVAHWLVRRRSADVPAGTEVILELSRPMSLSTTTLAREGGL
jgi:hypothetical protein